MLFTGRQAEILEIAKAEGRVQVEDLAARFSVTPQTIRKDLNDLCEARVLSRIHGGAIFPSGTENVRYEARRSIAAAEKQAIGRAAAAIIPDKASLFINIGTTTEEVAASRWDAAGRWWRARNYNALLARYYDPAKEVAEAAVTPEATTAREAAASWPEPPC